MSRPTALIVDDHEGFREAARALLEESGFAVIGEAIDGGEAIAAVARLRPWLVLLDVQLPDLDGFAVAARLADGPEPPVVVLTSTREARLVPAPPRRVVRRHVRAEERAVRGSPRPPSRREPRPAPSRRVRGRARARPGGRVDRPSAARAARRRDRHRLPRGGVGRLAPCAAQPARSAPRHHCGTVVPRERRRLGRVPPPGDARAGAAHLPLRRSPTRAVSHGPVSVPRTRRCSPGRSRRPTRWRRCWGWCWSPLPSGASASAAGSSAARAARRAPLPAIFLALVLVLEPVALRADVIGDTAALALYDVAIAAIAVVLVVDLVRARWSEAVVAGLVVDVAAEGRGGTLRDRLATTLGDPTLRARVLDRRPGAVRRRRRPADRARRLGWTVVTAIDSGGERIAALAHDPDALGDPGLVAAVATAARLARRERAAAGCDPGRRARGRRVADGGSSSRPTPSGGGSNRSCETAPSGIWPASPSSSPTADRMSSSR